MNQLEGKVAIVTGAAGGMGQAICRLFLAEGVRLLMTDLRAVASGLAEGLSANALFTKHDVTDEAQWQRTVNMAVERFGGVDILVNNAGWFDPLPMAQTSAEALHRHMSINALGVMLGMQSVIAPMRDRQGGSVVNICSTSAYKGSPGQFAYTASKWAVRGMTRAAAIELGPDRIRVNGIFPGLIDTRWWRASKASSERTSWRRCRLGALAIPRM